MGRTLGVLFLVVFLDLFGFGIVIPHLPFYAQEFGANGFVLGLLLTSYSLMQFIFSPIWGRLSDQWGRKPVLIISSTGHALSMCVLGLADDLTLLFVGRLMAGITAANISVAYAYVSDVTDEKNRAKGMGIMGAALGLGFTLGPGVGGFFAEHGASFSMFLAAGLSAANVLLAIVLLKESKKPQSEGRKKLDRNVVSEALRLPLTGPSIVLFFLFTLAVTQMESMLAIYMGAEFDFSAKEVGYLAFSVGMILVLIQGGGIGRLSKKFGERPLALSGLGLCALGMFVFGLSNLLAVSIVGLAFLSIGRGILHPSLSSLASQGAPEDFRGAALGVFQSASSLGRVLGPPMAGFLFDYSSHASPFLFAGIILLLAVVFALTRLAKNTAYGVLKQN